MADVANNQLKRPYPEDDQDGINKRPRSNNASPAPGGPPGLSPELAKRLAEAKAKAAAVSARLKGAKASSAASTAPTTTLSTATPGGVSEERKAQLRARVAALAQQRLAAPSPPTYQPPVFEDNLQRARGGLDVGLHPALLGDVSQDASKGRQGPQRTGTGTGRGQDSAGGKGNKGKNQLDLSGPSVEEIQSNPYFDSSLSRPTAKGRQTRQLIFNQKGKYIQQAAALRRQAHLEEMKKKIAAKARQAGIDEDLDVERAFLVQAPPPIEWWDEGLVDGDSYDAIDNSSNLKIESEDSIITRYVQHPVLLEPPQERIVPEAKPMFLTAKEQAKIRRQRRLADLKEQQAKVRLGLEPAPPPKVKKSNLMRVLGEEAVKDPTAVEARVNREIADRKDKHDQMNAERKLTKEQRHEKLAAQKEKDASKGIFTTVYRVESLANGRHRFKISENAKQNDLTGICIMHPKFNLIIVEGGIHGIRFYKKLMLNRIDWTENTGPSSVREGNKEVLAKWLEAQDEQTGELKDLGFNSCQLVFEGEQKDRRFRKWLGARVCESDSQAKEALGRAKMENFWTLAKSLGAQGQT